MIYYSDYGRQINCLTDEDCVLLESVYVDPGGCIRFKEWNQGAPGCLYYADEYFQTFCAMKYGFQPICLLEEEYKALTSTGIVYLSKERKRFINESLWNLRAAERDKKR